MKFKFDSNLKYQKKAIDSTVSIFDGQATGQVDFEISNRVSNNFLNEIGSGNEVTLDENELLDNINYIQLENSLPKKDKLDGKNFTIEMETGTGKTYVYLRTIIEMHQDYGFNKFIIVVPSVAIKEGVYKSLQITEDHFKNLYNNINYKYFIYDSDKLGEVRSFAKGVNLQIMIINIQAFNKKKNNIIHRENDRMNGRKPIEFIQATNPVVVIDEPQNMETKKSKQAINSLNPLCTLRYSATHKNLYNLMYRLGPVDAYNNGLVKKIEVYSITEDEDYNYPYIKLHKVDNKNGIKAQISIDVKQTNKIKRKKFWIKSGTDLYEKSGERDLYQNWTVSNISMEFGTQSIKFTNGNYLEAGDAIQRDKEAIQRAQIRATIIEHLNKEKRLRKQGIKVLSLFFIDKVANYREYDDKGPKKGKFAQWFEEEFEDIISRKKYDDLQDLRNFDINQIHNGYFAKDRKGNWRDTPDTKISRNSKAADAAYQLIMKDKEQLLNNDEPLRFIFSHSALREGWDNPNVFQICTLNETKSKMKKRQEIGRGLRLPVNDEGIRIKDESINILTVIANESYEEYVAKLQNEMEKEAGEKFGVIESHFFTKIGKTDEEESKQITHEESKQIFNDLKEKGYIDENGRVKEKFFNDLKDEEIELDSNFNEYKQEIIELVEQHASIKSRVKNARKKKRVKLNNDIYTHKEFIKLWDQIKHKTTYRVEYSTEELIKRSLKALEEMPEVREPKIVSQKSRVKIEHSGIDTDMIKDQRMEIKHKYQLPDILSYLQNETNLTRKTIADILIKSERLDEFEKNPQKFMDQVAQRINRVLNSLIVEGIKYEKIDGQYYEMQLFENEELEKHVDRILETTKTVYDHVIFDSKTEKEFAEKLDNREDILLFTKLPDQFTIDTPVGKYNPDWAIVKEDEMENKKLYLVRETKGSKLAEDLREAEEYKTICGKKHFDALGTDYEVVTSAEEV